MVRDALGALDSAAYPACSLRFLQLEQQVEKIECLGWTGSRIRGRSLQENVGQNALTLLVVAMEIMVGQTFDYDTFIIQTVDKMAIPMAQRTEFSQNMSVKIPLTMMGLQRV